MVFHIRFVQLLVQANIILVSHGCAVQDHIWWYGSLIRLSYEAGLFLSEGVRCGADMLWFMQKRESSPIHSGETFLCV